MIGLRVLRRLDDLAASLRSIGAAVRADIAERRREALRDPGGAEHEIRTDNGDDVIARFVGQVPRVGDVVWTDGEAWSVVQVAWWVRGAHAVSTACVYAQPLKK